MNKIELLAPAGDMERLKIAYLYGADACYIGGKDYSLRANASNFSLEDIKEAARFAHKLKRFSWHLRLLKSFGRGPCRCCNHSRCLFNSNY